MNPHITDSLKYFDTDLLCYRAPPGGDIARAQERQWDPILDWFLQKFGHDLQTTHGLQALRQSPAARDAVQTYLEKLNPTRLELLCAVTHLCGSLVLAIAFTEGKIDESELYAAIRIEEKYKADFYGDVMLEEKNLKNDLQQARKMRDELAKGAQ